MVPDNVSSLSLNKNVFIDLIIISINPLVWRHDYLPEIRQDFEICTQAMLTVKM